MASESSATQQSLAPTDFNVIQSFEVANGAISVAVEHCQLCRGTRRAFHCKDCVNSGQFTSSRCKTSDSQSDRSDRYADKLQRWHSLKRERSKILERIESSLTVRQRVDKKKNKIAMTKERIELLRRARGEACKSHEKEQEDLQRLQEENNERDARTMRRKEKKVKIREFLNQYGCRNVEKLASVCKIEEEITSLRREHVRHLMTYIFPISEIHHRIESDCDEQRTVNALADARRTSYVRGRWIYADNGSEQHYQMIYPTLPGNGDYSAYSSWLLDNKDLMSSQDSEIGQQNPVYTLGAALSYTTQLVLLLAHFLDVNLPKKLCYGEFCGHQLTEAQFNKAVYKLNQNVLHLCFTQNIDPESLHPRHTVHNILVLLRSPELGRSGSFQVNPELMQSLDESHQTGGESDYVSSSEDEPDGVEREWEQVPTTLPEVAGSRAAESYFTSQQAQSRTEGNAQTTTSMAGGLMTSAAASVASFWRAATGRKHS